MQYCKGDLCVVVSTKDQPQKHNGKYVQYGTQISVQEQQGDVVKGLALNMLVGGWYRRRVVRIPANNLKHLND